MRVTVLGCGGSMGVPMVGGHWGKCDPRNPRNNRRRPSILVQTGEVTVLVDTTPDLRVQLLDAEIQHIDAVLFTHEHADHVHGLDDLRPITYRTGKPVPAYGNDATLRSLEERFGYAVASVDVDRGAYKPVVTTHRIDGPFSIGDLPIQPIDQDHGSLTSLGFRFGPFAYSTDVVAFSDDAFALLDGVDVWMVDATREEPHPSHAHLAQTLEWIAQLKPRRAYLTHMNHMMDYDRLVGMLPDHIRPAHDGLVLEFEGVGTAGNPSSHLSARRGL